tara:strand:- start:4211 stop:4525 length:315 start_codon:yes stop_codon:yes gene_type:complete
MGVLRIHCGTIEKGVSLHIHHDGEADLVDDEENTKRGWIRDWTRAAIKSTRGNDCRLRIIEPHDYLTEYEHQGLLVRGFYRVVETVNNTEQAREAWRAFKEDPE